MALIIGFTWLIGAQPAGAECSADQDLLGYLQWVDHVVRRGSPMAAGDLDTLAARQRALLAGDNMARLRKAGHLKDGNAVPQLLGLIDGIVAERRIGDLGALDGVLRAVYVQLSDECEAMLGATLKDWISASREMLEDDIKAAGGRSDDAAGPLPLTGAGKLVLALAGLIGLVFGIRVLWLWGGSLFVRRTACRIACDLIVGEYRFQGFVTLLDRSECRFAFPESALNDFRAALARTTNCTLVIGPVEVPGLVRALWRSSLGVHFHRGLDRRTRSSLLDGSIEPPRVGTAQHEPGVRTTGQKDAPRATRADPGRGPVKEQAVPAPAAQ